MHLRFEIVVIGGGPAGIAAAVAASQSGNSVALIDDNPRLGGQIWRGGASPSQPSVATHWFNQLENTKVRHIGGARVIHADGGFLEAETGREIFAIRHNKLILATGARELFLPFPGWTLPNVMGAGGLQALVKSGLPIKGKRVVVAGTGPLLLAVAAYLIDRGAKVVCICEQASSSSLAAFAFQVLMFPGKIVDAVSLLYKCRALKHLTNCWVVAAIGKNSLESVTISENGRTREIPCDYFAYGYHLVPNTELAQMLGCQLREGFVQTDEFQRTSQPGIYCAGEPTGIGGMELSVIEGSIAGHAAANSGDVAQKLFPARARYRKLAEAMKKAFRLRPELATLAKPDTLLCRCEDIPFERVRTCESWKAAKLHSRCGMGPCQGRICGAAAHFLFGWNIESTRPPVFPARCASLAAISSSVEVQPSHGGSQ
ncbi:MAG TPA: FAD/NAD(P)-binding oxidoreductase [Candidatus Acidoferrum sp.]|nr:FAD/NAD(P)-binding oxidoreductase [Candidatus Acidoferrum sp.]